MLTVGDAQRLGRPIAQRAAHVVTATGVDVMVVPDVQQGNREQPCRDQLVHLVGRIGDLRVDTGGHGRLTGRTEVTLGAGALCIRSRVGLGIDDTGIGNDTCRRVALELEGVGHVIGTRRSGAGPVEDELGGRDGGLGVLDSRLGGLQAVGYPGRSVRQQVGIVGIGLSGAAVDVAIAIRDVQHAVVQRVGPHPGHQ